MVIFVSYRWRPSGASYSRAKGGAAPRDGVGMVSRLPEEHRLQRGLTSKGGHFDPLKLVKKIVGDVGATPRRRRVVRPSEFPFRALRSSGLPAPSSAMRYSPFFPRHAFA